jgi:hypothetical protein
MCRGGAAAVMPLLGEVAGILVHAYADPFHEMIKAAATASEKLAAALPHGALETHLSSLIKVHTRHPCLARTANMPIPPLRLPRRDWSKRPEARWE